MRNPRIPLGVPLGLVALAASLVSLGCGPGGLRDASDDSSDDADQTADLAALPDVIVTSLSYGGGVFTSVVTNRGLAATPSDRVIGVLYSVDGVPKTWGAVRGPLAAGASITVGTNGGAYDIPTDTYTMTALVDDVHRFAESDETNNSLSVLVEGGVVVKPDAVVTALSYADGVFTATVRNQGRAATPVGTAIGVSYRVDGIVRTWGAVAGPLPAGASITVGTSGASFVIPSGEHAITAYVDDINRFSESSETNNKFTQTIFVSAGSADAGTDAGADGGADAGTTPGPDSGLDTVAPAVAVVAPVSGSTVTGASTTISASATDNVGVIGVQFKVDGVAIGTEDTTAPFSVSWNTTSSTNGAHTLTATARDAAGNSAVSAGVVVTVSNTQTPPPPPPPPVGTLTFSSDWDDGQILGFGNQNWKGMQAVGQVTVGNTDRYRLLRDGGARQGNYYARVEVRPGDDPLNLGKHTERSEVLRMQNADGTDIRESVTSGTVQYAFSVKFDPSWQAPVFAPSLGGWAIFLQLHGPSWSQNTNWAFDANGADSIRFAVRTGDLNAVVSRLEYFPIGSLNKGKWIDFIYTVKYAEDNTGSYLVQRRDEGQTSFTTVLNLQNRPTLQYVADHRGEEHYMKMGLYRNEQTFTSILYNDGFTRSLIAPAAK
jgi:hypothetical protein